MPFPAHITRTLCCSRRPKSAECKVHLHFRERTAQQAYQCLLLALSDPCPPSKCWCTPFVTSNRSSNQRGSWRPALGARKANRTSWGLSVLTCLCRCWQIRFDCIRPTWCDCIHHTWFWVCGFKSMLSTYFRNWANRVPAKLPDYFLWSIKRNINQIDSGWRCSIQAEAAMLRSERDLLRGREGVEAGSRNARGGGQQFAHYNFSALTRDVERLTRQLSEEAAQLMHDIQRALYYPQNSCHEQLVTCSLQLRGTSQIAS